MQYSTILLSALAATGSLAAPARRQVSTQVIDDSIRVGLSGIRADIASGTNFDENLLAQTKRPTGSRGPYDTVTLDLGEDIQNPALRCQVLDRQGQPIVVVRGANVDITFADGGAGPWTFRDGEALVSSITCDPRFKKGVAPPAVAAVIQPEARTVAAQDTAVRVQLSDGNLARQTAFNQAGLVKESKASPDSSSPFNEVSLRLGADVTNQELRCQILDASNKPITLKRGQNIDTTFAKGDKWTFESPKASQVSKIVCDPKFKKASA